MSASPNASCMPAATARTGSSRVYKSLAEYHPCRSVPARGREHAGLCRFSTVAGNKGSFDLARDVRGFAVKLYTKEGNWDLVGNNIPVFFIQDAIKFPDLIHAVKQEPDRAFPAGADRARQFLGFHLADARKHAHDHVDHVGPRHSALVPLHGRLWRPYLPAGQRRRTNRPSSNSTGSRSLACSRWCGTRPSRSTAPTQISIAAICGTRSQAAISRNGNFGLQLFDQAVRRQIRFRRARCRPS